MGKHAAARSASGVNDARVRRLASTHATTPAMATSTSVRLPSVTVASTTSTRTAMGRWNAGLSGTKKPDVTNQTPVAAQLRKRNMPIATPG